MNRLRQLEQEVLLEGREWMRQRLEEKLQSESEQVSAECPRSGQGLKQTRWRSLQMTSVVGILRLRVRHGYSEALKRWVCPAREAWGLQAAQRLSPELESLLAYTASQTPSYEAAAEMARRWGTKISAGCIHRHVQTLGRLAGELEPPPTEVSAPEPPFSMVIMPDGWMARERGPDWGVEAPKNDPQRVVWHEIKSAVIYRLEQRAENASGRGMLIEKFAVATPPETSPVDFGAAVQAEARRRGLGRAHKVYLVMDGAIWLWDLAQDRFAKAIKTLDFHHARDHLWALAHALHGQDTDQAKAWVEPLLKSLREGGEDRVVGELEELLETTAQGEPEFQKVVKREVKYFQNHRDHLHYQAMEQAGAPRGSGAVESLGKQFQRRLRSCGQIWSRPGLTNLLHLCVLFKNKDDPLLWN